MVILDEKKDITAKLVEYFGNKPEIDAAILFGSFAKNKFNEHSDIDIAVHSKNELSYDNLAQMQVELSLLCKREVDVADLSKAEGLFLHQIMTTGERIKFDHNVYHKYIMKALYFYEDFLPIQRACRAEKIKRLING
jgi:predicted nucleotidyltransferase